MIVLLKLTLVGLVVLLAVAPLVLVFVVVTAPATDARAIPFVQLCQVPLLLILSVAGWSILFKKITGGL